MGLCCPMKMNRAIHKPSAIQSHHRQQVQPASQDEAQASSVEAWSKDETKSSEYLSIDMAESNSKTSAFDTVEHSQHSQVTLWDLVLLGGSIAFLDVLAAPQEAYR